VFVLLISGLAPVLIMPLFNKYVPLGPEHGRPDRAAEAAGRALGDACQRGVSLRYEPADQGRNAALTGMGATRRIILGDTLLAEFTPDEVESVIAHELGHQVHRDIPIGIVVSSFVTLIALFVVALVLNWGARALGFSGPADVGALPLLALAMGIFGLLTLPANNAYSRWREARADATRSSRLKIHRPSPGAMTRLANQNLADADPQPWVVFLLYSHPPIRQRLAMAANWKAPGRSQETA